MMGRSDRFFNKTVRFVLILSIGMMVGTERLSGKENEGQMSSNNHFIVVSDSKSFNPKRVEAHLERTWQTFRDLFGVTPPVVKVVFTTLPGSPRPCSRADRERTSTDSQKPPSGGFQGPVIPWAVSVETDPNICLPFFGVSVS